MNKMSPHVFEALSLLKPYDIDKKKIRVGKERDGGYVMADLATKNDVISFGVGPEISFEKQLADAGHHVFMYDHTVAALPEQHDRFVFSKTGICAEGEVMDDAFPLRTHLDKLGRLSPRLDLKMDVEGSEWGAFATAAWDLLERFDQIVVEVHWLVKLSDPTFAAVVIQALRNITAQFTLFHVHANNCGEIYIVDGFAVADVLELSFVRSCLVERRASTTIFPEAINKSNHPDAHDLPLLFYPFLPTSVSEQRVHDVIRRLELEEKVRD